MSLSFINKYAERSFASKLYLVILLTALIYFNFDTSMMVIDLLEINPIISSCKSSQDITLFKRFTTSDSWIKEIQNLSCFALFLHHLSLLDSCRSLYLSLKTLTQEKIQPQADIVGILFPIHAHTFPWVVEVFLKKIDLQSNSYIFALSSRECTEVVFSDINKILKNKNIKLDASFTVNTPVNFIPVFALPTKEEIISIEKELLKRLDIIQKIISNKISFYERMGPIGVVLGNNF